ncbi:MAG: tripartite tricarboxylate transporter substrate binding protein [Alphaproteobacteria bacterium]|nr:tripartite tricarboxylate transporter substrate binding protein [Alphaproteobacteria bacterium]
MRRFLIALAAMVLTWATASAQTYPQRPARLVLQFGPGAGADITARLLGDRLSARWGKAVIIENRPGGDGLVAINAFTSASDDHTLLFVPTSAFTAHPYTHDKLPYDSERDLVPIVSVTTIVVSFAVPGDSEVKSLGEFVALARAKPDTMNVAAAPGNSDLMISSFIKTQNLPVAKVPYRDILQAPNDLAQGRLDALLTSYAAMSGLIQSGKIKVLAVTSKKRVGILPDIPTVTEAGFPFLGMDSLIGIYGPRGMPDALRDKIAADVRAVIAADPTIAQRLGATAQVVDVRGPAEFSAGIKEMRDQLADVAKVLGIKAAQQTQ